MKLASQLHTLYINKKYGRTGKLWENRYKLNIVDPEYAWVIARYIELNTLRAGMVPRAHSFIFKEGEKLISMPV